MLERWKSNRTMSSSVSIGGRRKQNKVAAFGLCEGPPMFIPGRAQQTGDSSSAMRCWSLLQLEKTRWEPGARLPRQCSFGNAGRVGNPVRALSAFWYDRQTTILRERRFPPRSIDHQSGFHGMCGSTCLATLNRHAIALRTRRRLINSLCPDIYPATPALLAIDRAGPGSRHAVSRARCGVCRPRAYPASGTSAPEPDRRKR